MERKCNIAFFRDSTAYLEHDAEKEAQLVKIPYRKDRLVAVLPSDHPLANEEQIALPQLATEYFAFIQQDTMPYELCMRACQEAGFVPQVVFTSHSLEAILDMVRKGSCVSLLFTNHVAFPHNIQFGEIGETPPFVSIPVTPEIWTTVYLAHLKGEKLSAAATHFIDYCKTTTLD